MYQRWFQQDPVKKAGGDGNRAEVQSLSSSSSSSSSLAEERPTLKCGDKITFTSVFLSFEITCHVIDTIPKGSILLSTTSEDAFTADSRILKHGEKRWRMVEDFNITQQRSSKDEIKRYRDVEDGIAWVDLMRNELRLGKRDSGDWWVEHEYTDASLVAPLLALGLGLNLTILQAKGDPAKEGEMIIESQQYGLKGKLYKKRFAEMIEDLQGDTLGAMMGREREFSHQLERMGMKDDFMREVVYKETHTLLRIGERVEKVNEAKRNGRRGERYEFAENYAELFGRKLLLETSIIEQTETRSKTGFKYPITQSAPVMSLAFVWGDGAHHFVNIGDVNAELQRTGNNDVDGAKSEFSSRMNEMITAYRNGGRDVYTEALKQHAREESRRRYAEKRELDKQRVRSKSQNAREKRQVTKSK